MTCPECQQQGAVVDGQIVKAMLIGSLFQYEDGATYHFCATPSCAVVYYSANTRFMQAHIREAVYQKQPLDTNPLICYCFDYRVNDVLQDSQTVQEITRGTQQGTCACDIRNPQGSCCLGNVRILLRNS